MVQVFASLLKAELDDAARMNRTELKHLLGYTSCRNPHATCIENRNLSRVSTNFVYITVVGEDESQTEHSFRSR